MTSNKFYSYVGFLAMWGWGLAFGLVLIANVPVLSTDGPIMSGFVILWVSATTIIAKDFSEKLYERLCIL